MSIMLARYSGFSPEIFERGIIIQMSDSALRLYIFLCRNSDRKSRLTFNTTDREIFEQTGASTRSLCNARINLTKLGLIACEKSPGGSYAYSLCDVDTGKPFPGDPTVKAKYKKKTKLPLPERSISVASAPKPIRLEWDDPPDRELPVADTSFAYGHNAKPTEKVYFPIDVYDDPR